MGRGWGVEGLGKKEKRLMDNSMVIAGEGDVSGLNGNGGKTIRLN